MRESVQLTIRVEGDGQMALVRKTGGVHQRYKPVAARAYSKPPDGGVHQRQVISGSTSGEPAREGR